MGNTGNVAHRRAQNNINSRGHTGAATKSGYYYPPWQATHGMLHFLKTKLNCVFVELGIIIIFIPGNYILMLFI